MNVEAPQGSLADAAYILPTDSRIKRLIMSRFKLGHQCYLRVKRKSLASEIRHIKKEIKKALPGSNLQASLQSHLECDVRREYRAASFANAFLRGKPVESVEKGSAFTRWLKSEFREPNDGYSEILRKMFKNLEKFGKASVTPASLKLWVNGVAEEVC